MFGKPSRSELERENAELRAVLEKFKRKAFLITIDRVGRVNKFTFMRGAQITTVETMGMLSDDVKQWGKDLID